MGVNRKGWLMVRMLRIVVPTPVGVNRCLLSLKSTALIVVPTPVGVNRDPPFCGISPF